MTVTYTRTQNFIINPRVLEEYFEVENGENLTEEEMVSMFSEIPTHELIDLCDMFNEEDEVTI